LSFRESEQSPKYSVYTYPTTCVYGIYMCVYVYRYFWPDRDTTPKSYRYSRRLSRNPEAAPVSRAGHGRVRPLSFYETSDKRPLARISVSFVNLSDPRPTRDTLLFLPLFITFRIFIIFFLSRFIVTYAFFLMKI